MTSCYSETKEGARLKHSIENIEGLVADIDEHISATYPPYYESLQLNLQAAVRLNRPIKKSKPIPYRYRKKAPLHDSVRRRMKEILKETYMSPYGVLVELKKSGYGDGLTTRMVKSTVHDLRRKLNLERSIRKAGKTIGGICREEEDEKEGADEPLQAIDILCGMLPSECRDWPTQGDTDLPCFPVGFAEVHGEEWAMWPEQQRRVHPD